MSSGLNGSIPNAYNRGAYGLLTEISIPCKGMVQVLQVTQYIMGIDVLSPEFVSILRLRVIPVGILPLSIHFPSSVSLFSFHQSYKTGPPPLLLGNPPRQSSEVSYTPPAPTPQPSGFSPPFCSPTLVASYQTLEASPWTQTHLTFPSVRPFRSRCHSRQHKAEPLLTLS